MFATEKFVEIKLEFVIDVVNKLANVPVPEATLLLVMVFARKKVENMFDVVKLVANKLDELK